MRHAATLCTYFSNDPRRNKLRLRKSQKLKYKQTEIFHYCFQYTSSNLSDFKECSFLLQSVTIFPDKCVKMNFEYAFWKRYALYYAESKIKLHRFAYDL